MRDESAGRFRAGLLFGLVAYTCWGLVPLYFAALKDAGVPAPEILAHRITWSVPVLFLCTAVAGGWADLGRVLGSRRLVLTLFTSALFLAVNWLIYIHATLTDRVAEAGLGYFTLPLVNAALATAVLGERLRPLHFPALALVAGGLAVPAAVAGTFPWVAVVLPVTFGIYGLIRKRAPVESMTGLTVESLLMLPPALGYLLYLWWNGTNHLAGDWGVNGLVLFSGLVTVVPLLTFTLSIRRLPLLAVVVIQFLSPMVQLLLAVYVLGEPQTPDRWVAFGCTGVAVVLFVADAVAQVRSERRKAAQAGGLCHQGAEVAGGTGLRPVLPVRR